MPKAERFLISLGSLPLTSALLKLKHKNSPAKIYSPKPDVMERTELYPVIS